LETTLTNQKNSRVGKIEECLHHSVQNRLSYRQISSQLQIKVLLSVAFHERETWSLTQREEQRLAVSDKKESEEESRWT
jgi:hypothetical protein